MIPVMTSDSTRPKQGCATIILVPISKRACVSFRLITILLETLAVSSIPIRSLAFNAAVFAMTSWTFKNASLAAALVMSIWLFLRSWRFSAAIATAFSAAAFKDLSSCVSLDRAPTSSTTSENMFILLRRWSMCLSMVSDVRVRFNL